MTRNFLPKKTFKMATRAIKDKDALTYHHLSIPCRERRAGEVYVADLKVTIVPGTNNAYGIAWARYDDDCGYPQLVKELAHVAFEVNDLASALRDEDVIVEPREVAPGVKAAFINVVGAPVKLLEIDRSVGGESATNPVRASGKNLKYHHTGIPSNKAWEGEIKVPDLKLAYLPGQYNTYGIEWLRYEEGNLNPDIVKYIPHVAFEVDDVDQAIVGEKVIYHSGRSDPGIIVAMIEVDGASIEFLELDRSIVGNQYDR
jgi:hypothetical protein